MSLNQAVISADDQWINTVQFGMTIKERCIYALFYAGIHNVFVDYESPSKIEKQLKGLKILPLAEANINHKTLVINQSCLINAAFIEEQKKKVLTDKALEISELSNIKKTEILFYKINKEEDIQASRSVIRQSLQKIDETIFGKLINRKISTRLTLFVAERLSWITPNLISLLCLLLGVCSLIMLCMSTQYGVTLLAGIIFYGTTLLDEVDGELARLKYQFTTFGLWFDNIIDEVLNISMVPILGIYSYHLTGKDLFLLLSVLATVLILIAKMIQYCSIFLHFSSANLSEFRLPQFRNQILQWTVQILQHIPRSAIIRFLLMIFSLFAAIPFFFYGICLFSFIMFIGIFLSFVQSARQVVVKGSQKKKKS